MTTFKPAFFVVLATVLTLLVGMADAQARVHSSRSSSSSSKAFSVLNMQAYMRTVKNDKNIDEACAKRIMDKAKADYQDRSSKSNRKAFRRATKTIKKQCRI